MSIFISGLESFLGKELLRACKKRNIEATGIDSLPSTHPGSAVCDIRSAEVAQHIPEGVDTVIHLAALSSDPDCKAKAKACFDCNVMGTLNMLEAAESRGAKQFIFASSEWVYDAFAADEPPKTEESIINASNLNSEYAFSKLTSEINLRQHFQHGSLPITILRFGILYGPRDNPRSAVESIFKSVCVKDELTVGSLNTGRHFVHVSDAAGAILAAKGLAGFEILNVQADSIVTLGDVIEVGSKLTGKKPQVSESDADNPSRRSVSNAKIKSLTGWKPEITLEAGLRTLAERWKIDLV